MIAKKRPRGGKYREIYNKYLREKGRANRLWLDAIKNVPCLDCGRTFPPFCMDFDHVRGEKLYNVGCMAYSTAKRTLILAEIEKCDLVCANCHRIRTFRRSRKGED